MPTASVFLLRVDAMIRDLGSADPATELWVALLQVAGDPMTVGAEDAGDAVERDADVAVAVLFVERSGERVDDAVPA